MRKLLTLIALLLLWSLLLAEDAVFNEWGTRPGPATDETYAAVEYERGGVTLNDRCPVRKARLNLKMEPMWINEHPVGFC